MATRRTSAWLTVKRGRYPAELTITGLKQREPRLQPGERAVHITVEVDDEFFVPAPTPGTLIQVKAPLYPEPDVVVAELPQSSLEDRPADLED